MGIVESGRNRAERICCWERERERGREGEMEERKWKRNKYRPWDYLEIPVAFRVMPFDSIYSTPWLSVLGAAAPPVKVPPRFKLASMATISARISRTSLGTVLS